MATHSSILAWEIPWTEEPGRLQAHTHIVSGTSSDLFVGELSFKSFSTFSLQHLEVAKLLTEDKPKLLFFISLESRNIYIFNFVYKNERK